MTRHGHKGIGEIRGSALPSLRAYEDIVPGRLCAGALEACHRHDCLRCVGSRIKPRKEMRETRGRGSVGKGG